MEHYGSVNLEQIWKAETASKQIEYKKRFTNVKKET